MKILLLSILLFLSSSVLGQQEIKNQSRNVDSVFHFNQNNLVGYIKVDYLQITFYDSLNYKLLKILNLKNKKDIRFIIVRSLKSHIISSKEFIILYEMKSLKYNSSSLLTIQINDSWVIGSIGIREGDDILIYYLK